MQYKNKKVLRELWESEYVTKDSRGIGGFCELPKPKG